MALSAPLMRFLVYGHRPPPAVHWVCAGTYQETYTYAMRDVLGADFYNRHVLDVAPDLLGMYLVCKEGDREVAHRIIETEAYDGVNDLACHAAKGRTARTEVMFGSAGIWYVYLVYGMHHMLNVVTGEPDYPAAVLIRALASEDGTLSGPGKLTRALGIDRALNGLPANMKSGLWIEDRGSPVDTRDIVTAPRVGVTYAGVWAQKPWRFILSK